ncbi:LuxR C-terminal-related transcriptional regulator [Lentzea sp. NPDC051213]|uniref:response regulator transcription factor n=1 Tax=Lentzea sp. NPDC051213 TaxID=3364126 RepID=UPI00378A7FB0
MLHAADPLTYAGLTSLLGALDGIEIVQEDADVRVVVADAVTPDLLSLLRRAAVTKRVPVVLVVQRLHEAQLLAAIESSVVAVLPRAVATVDVLLDTIRTAAAGGGVLPAAMLGEVLLHVERLQYDQPARKAMNAAGMSTREVDVLRLIADGRGTAEVAAELCYSERTVKNVITVLLQRLKLRNRPHAVAYALRAGVI